jgi:hypothetical protein
MWTGKSMIGAVAALVTTLGAAGAVALPGIAHGAGPLSWSAPRLIDPQVPPLFSRHQLVAVSCASVSACVAVDDHGEVLSSTDPVAGAGAWRTDRMLAAAALYGVSCPSVGLCVAVGANGDVLSSGDPTAAAPRWRLVTIADSNRTLYRVSCPTRSFCAALDGVGDVATTTHPSGGAGAWKLAHVAPRGLRLIDVSCPSARLCVAVDPDGISVSTGPTRGDRSWRRITLFRGVSDPNSGDGSGLEHVWCPSAVDCVATFAGGNGAAMVATTGDPTGGKRAWHLAPLHISGLGLTSLSCPTIHFCAAGDENGDLVTSTQPGGRGAAWKSTSVLTDYQARQLPISCPSAARCVATDNYGDVLSSVDPTGGPAAWKVVTVDRVTSLRAVSCPSVSECVAADSSGNALTSTDPGLQTSPWQLVNVDGTKGLSTVSCAPAGLCVAGDNVPQVLTSVDPAAPDPMWQRASPLGPPEHSVNSGVAGDVQIGRYQLSRGIKSISCPSAGVCVALRYGIGGAFNDNGIDVATNPAAGTSAWSEVVNDGAGTAFDAVSCPSISLCVAVDEDGYAVLGTPTT